MSAIGRRWRDAAIYAAYAEFLDGYSPGCSGHTAKRAVGVALLIREGAVAVLFSRTAPGESRRDLVVEEFARILQERGLLELARETWPGRGHALSGQCVAVVVALGRRPKVGDRELFLGLAAEAGQAADAKSLPVTA
jgi:hypothetical protein